MTTRREVYQCVTDKNLPALRAAIAAGHSVNECGLFRESPLMLAAQKNLVDMMRVLLDSGADIEAQNRFGDTALFMACDYSSVDAALLLVARGAKGDSQGANGRTTLQIAVKRGLVDVVQALLETGQADPQTKSVSGKDALHYVPSKGAHTATLQQLISDYMSMDNAIASGNARAVEVLLRRVIQTDNLEASVDAYLAGTRVVPLESYRIYALLRAIAASNVEQFERLLIPHAEWPMDPQARLEALKALRFASHSDTSALHIAAFYGHATFVEYLLLDCGMDPCVEDGLKRRPVQLVNDLKDPTGAVRVLLVQVTRRRQVAAFTDRLLSCSGTVPQLEGLAQSLSSVYDLRVVFSLSASALARRPDDMKRVLTQAFTRLVDEKLVFNDREALFSKMTLRECLRRNLVTPAEFEYWNMQVVKVNMESAAWVSALKQSVLRVEAQVADVERRMRVLQNEYKNLRAAVTNGGDDKSALGQSLSMVTSLLGVLDDNSDDSGGIGDAFGSVLDVGSPQDVLAAVLSAAGAGDVAGFLSDATSSLSDLMIPNELQAKFEAASVNVVEFAGLLKDAILSDQAEAQEDVGQDAALEEVGDRFADVALEDSQQNDEDDDVGDDPLVAFPYHFAVKHSDGELFIFQDVIQYITPADGDVNAVTTVKVETDLELSAVEYASYLGYVDIVKSLLLRPDVIPTEKKFVTMQRAQQRAASVA